MPDETVIRQGTMEDLPGLMRIAVVSHEAPLWTPEQYAEALGAAPDASLRRMVLVAEREGVVTGFAVITALCSVTPPEGELESIAVAPGQRGRGIGRELVRAAVAWTEDQGVVSLRLEVRAANACALHLYVATGFKASGRRRAYYADPVDDAVCMTMLLAPQGQPRR